MVKSPHIAKISIEHNYPNLLKPSNKNNLGFCRLTLFFCYVLLFTTTNINIIVSEIIILFKCGNTE